MAADSLENSSGHGILTSFAFSCLVNQKLSLGASQLEPTRTKSHVTAAFTVPLPIVDDNLIVANFHCNRSLSTTLPLTYDLRI